MADGDLISRQAVDTLVDELARAISDERCFISRGRSTGTIMQDILDLPSVTPQPKEKQTDGDLISRKAVIDLLNRLIEVERKQGTDVMNYGRERVNAYESILDEIESDYLFPSITSAEKTAE